MVDTLIEVLCNVSSQRLSVCADDPTIVEWAFSSGGQTFISALIGAVVGAVVAGTIQFLISRAEFKRNVRQSAAEHRRTRRSQLAEQLRLNKTTALHIGVKVVTLTNQMYSTVGLILQTVNEANSAGFDHLTLAEKMTPMTGISRSGIRFDDSELAFLFWSNEADLANKLLLLTEKSRSLVDTIHAYNDARLSLPEVTASGNDALIAIRRIELRDLANGLCQSLEEDFRYVLGIMDDLPTVFHRVFTQTNFFSAAVPNGGQERLTMLTSIFNSHGIAVLG